MDWILPGDDANTRMTLFRVVTSSLPWSYLCRRPAPGSAGLALSDGPLPVKGLFCLQTSVVAIWMAMHNTSAALLQESFPSSKMGMGWSVPLNIMHDQLSGRQAPARPVVA